LVQQFFYYFDFLDEGNIKGHCNFCVFPTN
jgi:hypothetical protein